MTWLLSQIWLALGLAALLGVMIGWCLHALRAGRARRELAGELEAARQQADGHYSNFNRVSAEANALRRDLEESRQRSESLSLQQSAVVEARTSELERELAGAKGELGRVTEEAANLKVEADALRQRLTAATETASVVAPAQAALAVQGAEGEDAASLRWRNRYLESRVRFLESRVSSAPSLEAAQTAEASYKERIAELETELAAAKSALAEEPVSTQPAPAATSGEDAARMEWKSRYLEARVAYLQGKLDESISSAAGALAEAPVVTTAVSDNGGETSAPTVSASGDDADLELSRLRWQNRYLEARLRHFEDQQIQPGANSVASAPAASEPGEVEGLRSRVVALEGEANAAAALRARVAELETAAASPADGQEAARLKWRARYLEGRVKYLEGLAFPAPAAATSEAIAEVTAEPAVVVSVEEQPSAEATPEPGPGIIESEPEPPVDLDANTRRPLALDAPRDGKPDDLKMIGGIGPKIEATLHELGIYHFDQIADWNESEAAWVDSYLRFTGRIGREEWIEQAKALAAGETTEAAQKYIDGEHT